MNQIKSIQLGVIAICIATVPLSLAQTPRIRTSGTNQTGAAARAPGGSIGNSIRAPKIGTNAGSAINTGAIPNIGAHTATNAGAETGISNQAIGMIGTATGKDGSSGNSTVAAQTGINASTGTNTKASTNAGAQTGTAASAGTGAKSIQPQFILESTPSPNLSRPTPSPTPIPAPTPIPSPSLGPSATPSP